MAWWSCPKNFIIVDNIGMEVIAVHNIFPEEYNNTSKEDLFKEEIKKFESLLEDITNPSGEKFTTLEPSSPEKDLPEFHCEPHKEDFKKSVQTCLNHIREGDIFQIQISRRAKLKVEGEHFDIYRKLRQLNPSPFMYFLNMNQHGSLFGASPELLVKVENGEITIRPIAGTRRRKSNKQTEEEIIHELQNDEKERAEHIMLVDLARHDIGRVAEFGSVKVKELMIVEKYSHVVHMVSEVVGKVKEGCNVTQSLKAGFPAGTVTGTPRIRAMEIISQLEDRHREFYSGGIFFVDSHLNLKSALTIRSILAQGDTAYTQAAAGIVSDSKPDLEYLETENKMKACIQVLQSFAKESQK